MPKNGTLFSRAYFIAKILPSIPLCPKPGATTMPCKFDNDSMFSVVIFSEFISSKSTFVSLTTPARE